MTGLNLRGITKSFGDTRVLRGVDLSIEDGEFLAILGPSGCGKSTLLRIIAGLEVQDSGTVSVGGRTIDGLAPKERDAAFVFQSYALYPHMTVAQNLSLPLVMRDLTRAQRLPFVRHMSGRVRTSRRQIREAVERAANVVGIAPLLDRKPGQLSGGQRQRVALARALVRQPKLFLLDEPLSNLDASLRASTRTEIVTLQRRLATTTVYVTHDQTEAMTMADRIAIMIDGQIVQFGAASEIYNTPTDIRAALFLGSPRMNIFETIHDAAGIHMGGTRLPIEVRPQDRAKKLRIGIRPEHVEIEGPDAAGTIGASIRHTEFLGSDAFVHLELPDHGRDDALIARAHPESVGLFKPGRAVGIRLRQDRLHFFDDHGRRVSSPISSARQPAFLPIQTAESRIA